MKQPKRLVSLTPRGLVFWQRERGAARAVACLTCDMRDLVRYGAIVASPAWAVLRRATEDWTRSGKLPQLPQSGRVA